MSDIFISYAREDRERAKELADALAARGWSVWWDREIPIGESFSKVIEEQLAGARCVIVLWSEESVNSEWVQNEAADGVARNILVPAFIADVPLPLEFRRRQTANLTDWRQGMITPELEKLMRSVEALVQPGASPAPPVERTDRYRIKRSGCYVAIGTIVPIILIVVVLNWRDRPPVSPSVTTITEPPTTTTEPPPPANPARAVGLLIVNRRAKCTAFLIANDIAVTAPSCIVEHAPLPVLRLGTRSEQRDYAVEDVLVNDKRKGIAALRVRGSPGTTFPPIPYHARGVRPGENVTLSGRPCNVVEVRANEFHYRCVARAADVGAPILGSDNYLLGMHSGGTRNNDPQLHIGIPTSAFFGVIQHWWATR